MRLSALGKSYSRMLYLIFSAINFAVPKISISNP
jgi:hypothetical protein